MDTFSTIVYLLFKVAVVMSPYDWPTGASMPEIYWPNDSGYVEVTGSHSHTGGYAHYRNGVIYMNEQCTRKATVNSPLCKAVIVHEIVHYLQDLNGKLDLTSCEAIERNERETYLVQHRYLKSKGFAVPRHFTVNVDESNCNKQSPTSTVAQH